jgi:hypothetical protein
LERYSDIVI